MRWTLSFLRPERVGEGVEEGGELSANDAPRQCHLPGANAGQGNGSAIKRIAWPNGC